MSSPTSPTPKAAAPAVNETTNVVKGAPVVAPPAPPPNLNIDAMTFALKLAEVRSLYPGLTSKDNPTADGVVADAEIIATMLKKGQSTSTGLKASSIPGISPV